MLSRTLSSSVCEPPRLIRKKRSEPFVMEEVPYARRKLNVDEIDEEVEEGEIVEEAVHVTAGKRALARKALEAKRRALAAKELPLLKALRDAAAALHKLEMDAEMEARTCLLQHLLPCTDVEYSEENYGSDAILTFEQSTRFIHMLEAVDDSILLAEEALEDEAPRASE